MSEVRADVPTAFEDATGVVFHVEMPGRRVKVHVSTATLVEMGSGDAPGELASFVRENQPAMQRLVDEGVADGWKGAIALLV